LGNPAPAPTPDNTWPANDTTPLELGPCANTKLHPCPCADQKSHLCPPVGSYLSSNSSDSSPRYAMINCACVYMPNLNCALLLPSSKDKVKPATIPSPQLSVHAEDDSMALFHTEQSTQAGPPPTSPLTPLCPPFSRQYRTTGNGFLLSHRHTPPMLPSPPIPAPFHASTLPHGSTMILLNAREHLRCPNDPTARGYCSNPSTGHSWYILSSVTLTLTGTLSISNTHLMWLSDEFTNGAAKFLGIHLFSCAINFVILNQCHLVHSYGRGRRKKEEHGLPSESPMVCWISWTCC
jgi:hypothetical protein